MTEESSTIAVVEDDSEIRALVTGYLEREGFVAHGCNGGAAFDALRRRERVDLVVLDLMMPGEDGYSICRRLIAEGGPPVIILSAKGEDLDRIIGLELGADDYLAKPFNPRELTARIRAVLRRRHGPAGGDASGDAPDGLYRFSGWRLDINARALVDPGGRDVELSGGEFSLLSAFVQRPGRVLSRDQLLNWTRGRDADPFDRAIDVQLSRLRKKLGDDPRRPTLIKTVRGDGYVFTARVEKGG